MKRIKRIVPKYAIVPLVIVVLLNTLVYNGSKLISMHLVHYDFSIFIDKHIPFLPIFISVYILAYVHWIVGYIVISRENDKTCYWILSAEVVAKLICLFFFLVLPTTIVRPIVDGHGLWENLTRFIYAMDEPVNLFPSIHCLESWMILRGTMYLKDVSKTYKLVMILFAILVCFSTVFVKQHVFVDILGGILVVEIGLYLSKKFHLGNFFEKLNGRLKFKFLRSAVCKK